MAPRVRTSIGALLLAGTLLGCAGEQDWVRSGQDAAANGRDYAECRQQAQLEVWNHTPSSLIFPDYGVTPMDDPGLIGRPRGYPYGRNDPSYRLRQDRATIEGSEESRKLLRDCLLAKGFQAQPE